MKISPKQEGPLALALFVAGFITMGVGTMPLLSGPLNVFTLTGGLFSAVSLVLAWRVHRREKPSARAQTVHTLLAAGGLFGGIIVLSLALTFGSLVAAIASALMIATGIFYGRKVDWNESTDTGFASPSEEVVLDTQRCETLWMLGYHLRVLDTIHLISTQEGVLYTARTNAAVMLAQPGSPYIHRWEHLMRAGDTLGARALNNGYRAPGERLMSHLLPFIGSLKLQVVDVLSLEFIDNLQIPTDGIFE